MTLTQAQKMQVLESLPQYAKGINNRAYAVKHVDGELSEIRLLSLRDLMPGDAKNVVAIGYPDGGVDFTNEHMRDRIEADVMQGTNTLSFIANQLRAVFARLSSLNLEQRSLLARLSEIHDERTKLLQVVDSNTTRLEAQAAG